MSLINAHDFSWFPSSTWLTGTDDELIGGLGLARGGMQGIPPERPPEKDDSHKEGKKVLVTVAWLFVRR